MVIHPSKDSRSDGEYVAEHEAASASLPDVRLLGGGPYRIQAVAEMTGVPEPTLRAWERRYGVPVPRRTTSGYRLYGAREVHQVRTLRRLCDEGMSTAEAARAVLTEKPPEPWSGVEIDPYESAVTAMLAAVECFDDVAFDRHARRGMFLGSSGTVVDRVVVPALERIGDLWHEGELTIAQEHFASHRLGTLMRDLVRLATPEESKDRAIVACFADEDHDIGALGVAMRLAECGMRPFFLGARTPPGAIRSAVEGVSPRLVALSVTIAPPRARARELVDGYASACGTVSWMVGGAGTEAIGDLILKAGGRIAPPDLGEIRAEVRRAMRRPEPDARPDGRDAPHQSDDQGDRKAARAR